MRQLKKYGILFLIGFFLFPIIYQSVHIVLHHAHSNQQEHHDCHKINSTNFHISEIHKTHETDDSCPVCKYEFSFNELNYIPVFENKTPEQLTRYNELTVLHHYKGIFSNKSPRAPPLSLAV